jgi:hypothetical protein
MQITPIPSARSLSSQLLNAIGAFSSTSKLPSNPDNYQEAVSEPLSAEADNHLADMIDMGGDEMDSTGLDNVLGALEH